MWEWITSEAGAAWTALIASWILASGSMLYRRTRRHIVVREATRTVYAQVAPQAADRMTILVDNQPVRRLEELIVSIRNCTARAISNPAVRIALPEMRKLISLRAQAHPSPDMCRTTFRVAANTVVVQPSFLNPHRDHGHEVRVAMLLDGQSGEWLAGGQGEGWSARRGISIEAAHTLRWFSVGGVASIGWGIVDQYTIVTDTETGSGLWLFVLVVLWIAVVAAVVSKRGLDESSVSVVTAPDSVMSAGPPAPTE